MSHVYRVLRRRYARSPFDGEGAYGFAGRQSSPGTRLSYTSEHQSLAAAPSELTRFGDDFVRRTEHCFLRMSPALAPVENIWLLNPQHHSFRQIVARELEPLHYDPRMFSETGPALADRRWPFERFFRQGEVQ